MDSDAGLKCIAERIRHHKFKDEANRPSKEIYSSWPKQAKLICEANFEELKVLQEILSKPAEGVSATAAQGGQTTGGKREDVSSSSAVHVRDTVFRRQDLWIAVPLLLILAAIVLFAAERKYDWCGGRYSCANCNGTATGTGGGGGPVGPVVQRTTVPFNTDLVFDFNQSKPYSSQHEQKLRKALVDFFSQYEDIKILGIAAHTDPIGRNQRNSELAQERGRYLRDLIAEVSSSAPLQDRFVADHQLPEPGMTAEGSSAEDYAIWRNCFQQFQLGVAERFRPLEPLPVALNPTNREDCSSASAQSGADGKYPACRRLIFRADRDRNPAVFAERAENFRELTNCLAPMRHVLVSFQHARDSFVPQD